jgi:hypothetical protein
MPRLPHEEPNLGPVAPEIATPEPSNATPDPAVEVPQRPQFRGEVEVTGYEVEVQDFNLYISLQAHLPHWSQARNVARMQFFGPDVTLFSPYVNPDEGRWPEGTETFEWPQPIAAFDGILAGLRTAEQPIRLSVWRGSLGNLHARLIARRSVRTASQG